jgi:hypothetical protein
MKYDIEMASGAKFNIDWFRLSKADRRRHADRIEIIYACFYFLKMWKVA